ncbi:hypothetical protein GCM10011591_33580 [Nocardia camponoti]|uniref:Uncharacterized protein n=1 Tax=Nocardia camponoti TaxID=1616106 RepID=A0A917QMD9_9NOCA|nr:hypothetical protein GCM10011591_33580 [Nocardia camponoti]
MVITDNAAGAMKATTGDCSSAKATYRIAKVAAAQECAPSDAAFTGTVADKSTGLCLTPNFAADTCFADAGTRPAKAVDCSTKEATFKVIKRIDGQADELLCDAPATSFKTVANPKTTFCLAKP